MCSTQSQEGNTDQIFDHADVAPMEAQSALQGPIQAALQPAQDEDRARTSAAAEALAGIVASSSTYKAVSGIPCNHACCPARVLLLRFNDTWLRYCMGLTLQNCWLGALITSLPAVMERLTEAPSNQLCKIDATQYRHSV